ncbi:MAG TPA: transglutaminase-like domain-containing protein [Chitinophagaceae bacterium]|nr:transglutaminase-like domain-containing protein [Chitinophagaceae bacterium]
MKRTGLLVPLLAWISFSFAQDPTFNRNNLTRKIDTTNLDLAVFAKEIVGNTSSNYEKAEKLLHWLSNSLEWKYTDYQRRTVKEILARQGGNCFELAVVYMAMIKALNIQYRGIAEINIQPINEQRQATAAEKVKQVGLGMSVFGRQHNDHRWVEIFDDRNNEWVPADPSMNVIGVEQWLKARVWFGKRVTIDTAFTRDMLVPFAVFVVSDTSKRFMVENRTHHYLVDGFDKLYNNKVSRLPAWPQWVSGVNELSAVAQQAFSWKANLHEYGDKIAALLKTYEELKRQYSKQ